MNRQLITPLLVLVAIQVIYGGPVQKRSKREIYPELEPEKVEDKHDIQPKVCVMGDLVYTAEESVPSEQACMKCKCQPPGVQCETTQCKKKPGCRAIHKPNTCCPDYQCECEHEGRIYANGERLEQKPGTECKVCYCSGGEVQCAEVSCYIRADCEGQQVPGKCCPKYEHCPPKEPQLDRSTDLQNVTKIDANPIRENEINKTNENNILEINKKLPLETSKPEITIQEITPVIKEIPITSSPKREINQAIHGQLLVEEAKNIEKTTPQTILNTETNDVQIPDSESESSEILENYSQPSVLRIGDKLLFLKKGELVPEKDANTQSSIITIIGAEGLQRGFEDSLENHDAKTDKKLEDFNGTTEDLQSDLSKVVSEIDITDNVPIIGTSSYGIIDDIYSKINIESTTELNIIGLQNLTDLSMEDIYSLDNTTFVDFLDDFNITSMDDEDNVTRGAELSINDINITQYEDITTPKTQSSTQNLTEKEEIQEQNPEYPPLPDVMSPQNSDKLLEEIDSTKSTHPFVDMKILPEVLDIRSNRTVPNNISNTDWLKHETLFNKAATLPDVILKEIAPSDFISEETTTELLIAATTGKTLSKIGEENIKFGVSIENNQFTQNHIKGLSDIEDVSISATLTSSGRPIESLEDGVDASDELVTDSTNQQSQISSNENASVEGMSLMNTPDELVEMLPGLANAAETVTTTTTYNPKALEVEMIDTEVLNEDEKNITHQDDFAKQSSSTTTTKRPLDESEQIFEELDREIGLDSGDIVESKSVAEESNEAEMIFKELLEETDPNSTPKSIELEPRNRETAVLQRVSNAIAKFQLRDTKQSLDTSILGILRDFFSSQYRSYNKK